MLEKVMEKFIEQRAKLMDNLTIDLLKKADIQIDNTFSSFDMIIVMNELKKNGYKIVLKEEMNNTAIMGLYKLGDLYEELIYGYSIETKLIDREVKIVAKPLFILID